MGLRVASQICVGVVMLAMLSLAFARQVASIKGAEIARGMYPEVRLRKLHLVRPDLIPYPIYFEIYC